MPLRLLSCLPAFVLLFFIQKAECRLNDPFPNPVGNGSLFCYASVPSGKIDFELPGTGTSLRLKFDSDPRKEPGILGMFWRIPLLDSAFREIDRNVLEWAAPNETAYFFYKNSGSPDRLGCNVRRLASAGKYDVYLDSSGCWLAKKSLKGYEIVVEEIGNPDCFFQYKNFRLVKIGSGKPGAAYVLSYEKNLLKSVRPAKGTGAAALFEYDGGMLKSLRYGGKTFSFGYGEYSIGQSGGKPVKLLSEVACGGEKETYSYGRMGARERGVLLRGCGTGRAKGKSEVLRMTFTSVFGAKSWIEWCAETGMIMADNAGRYNTGNDVSDPLNPGYVGGARPVPGLSVVEYFQSGKQYPERYYYDWKNAILITTTGATGNTVKKSLIGSKGPNYLKTRKIEILNGDSVGPGSSWRLDKIYNYDDKGRFMRELDANGRVAAYAVADDINYCIYRDGKLVFEEVAGKGVVEKNYYMDSGTRMCRKFFDSGDSEYFTYGKDGTLCYYEYRDAGERVLKKMFEYGFITEDVSENEKRITDVSGKLVAIVKKGADGSFRIQNKVNN